MADLFYPLFPVWTLYLTGVSGLIGGNFDLGIAMLFASYTDVMPSASERATLFFLTTSMQYVAQALCPPVGGWLMNLDGKGGTPEVALGVSLATSFLAFLVTDVFFPETLDKSKLNKAAYNKSGDHAEEYAAQASIPDNQQKSLFRMVGPKLEKMWEDVKLGVSGAGLGNILLLALSVLCAGIGIKGTDWFGLVQYPVIKLGWSFPQVRTISRQHS